MDCLVLFHVHFLAAIQVEAGALWTAVELHALQVVPAAVVAGIIVDAGDAGALTMEELLQHIEARMGTVGVVAP